MAAKKPVVEVEEPVEAQPPPGVVLEEPGVTAEASDEEMAALRAAAAATVVVEDVPVVVSVETPVGASSVSVKFGDFVSFVLDREVLDRIRASGVPCGTLAPGDVSVALVIAEDVGDGVTLRLFVDAETVPVVRRVFGIPRPSEVTPDHAGKFFV